jgi:hypothetical protein
MRKQKKGPFSRPFDGKPDQISVGLAYLASPEGIAYLKRLRNMRKSV